MTAPRVSPGTAEWLRALIRPVCPHCSGEGGSMSGYYEPEFYACRCCNQDEANEEAVTRVWRWRWWLFSYRERQENKRIDRWVDSEVARMEQEHEQT